MVIGVIFRDLKGGLGNQLFIVGNILEQVNGRVFVFTDLYHKEGDYTNRKLDKSLELLLRRRKNVVFLSDYIPKSVLGMFKRLLLLVGLLGDDYFQSSDQSEHVLSTLKQNLLSGINIIKLNAFIKGIELNNAVAMHVRRGDFVQNTNEKHQVLTSSYYEEALQRTTGQLFIFTDDADFCKRQYPDATFLADYGFSDEEELILMSRFATIIVANSTFSYWAGLFSNGRIIAPKQLLKYESNLFKKGWIWI